MTHGPVHPGAMATAETVSPALTVPRSAWRRDTTLLLMVLGALTALFWATATSLVMSWAGDPLAHGYIIIPAVGYLAWHRRHLPGDVAPTSEWLAISAVAAFAAVWFVANLSDSVSIQQFCFVAIVIGFVPVVLGSAQARLLVFPLGLLLFGLPLGNLVIPFMQVLTANFVVKLLSYSHVPVLLQGHVISIPGAAWKVAEACSGINYLTASLALGYLYAGVTYRYWRHRIGFLAAAALIPLAANGLRVYGTILLAYVAGPQSVEGTRHYLFGWIVFSVMMIVLFVACGRWREEPVSTPPERPSDDGRAASFPKSIPVVRTAFALLLVGTAPVAARLIKHPVDVGTDDVRPPAVAVPWSVAGVTHDLWTAPSPQAQSHLVQKYRSGRDSVELYVGNYDVQPAADPVNELSDAWWPTAQGTRSVRLEGQNFHVRETHVESTSASLLVWSWYSIDGTFTGSKYVARLLLARRRLSGRSKPAAVMAVAVDAGATLNPETTLQNFLLHLATVRDARVQHFGPTLALTAGVEAAPDTRVVLKTPGN
jgi:exosortase A